MSDTNLMCQHVQVTLAWISIDYIMCLTLFRNELTAKLSGMIDAAVNGGTKLYEVFFTDAYPYFDESTQTTMKTRELEERLKRLMADQIPLLENGLRIHEIQIKKQPDMEPMHEHMESRFKDTKVEVQRKYGEGHCDIVVSRGKPRAAPPRPVTKMPTSESRSDLSRISTMLPHQTSVVESSKHRFYNALSRKKSNVNERTSAGRPSIIEEVNGVSGGGGPDSNGSNTSSINLGNDADNSATVVITHRASYLSVGGSSSRPTSGHYLSSSTPLR